MRAYARRLSSALVALVLTSGLVPAVAAPRPALANVTAQWNPVTAYAKDPYDTGDDTIQGARDVTAKLGGPFGAHGFGMGAVDETHSIYVATDESAPGAGDARCDVDWFKVKVDDPTAAAPYLVEAKSLDPYMDPVIEVYRTGAHPSDPASLPASTDLSTPGSGCIAAGDDGAWLLGGSASVSFVPTEPTTYYFRVRPRADLYEQDPPALPGKPVVTFRKRAGPYTLRLKIGSATRLALPNTSRVQTAIQMSREAFPDFSLPQTDPSGRGTVVVANGWNYPDAIAGSVLAGVVRGPLLLTHPDYLDKATGDEIRRLGARRVFILGSGAAVLVKVRQQLETVVGVGNVYRVEGPLNTGRVETAVAIAKRARLENGAPLPKLAFVCNGWSFPDALAASPVSAYAHAPILLTHGSTLDTSTANAITELGVTDVVVVGSTGAVGKTVEDKLKATLNKDGKAHVKRVGGAGRYATAAAIAAWATGDHGLKAKVGTDANPAMLPPLDWRRMGVATGEDYPDALGGGVFCGLSGHPLLLTPGKKALSPYILDVYGAVPTGSSAYLSLVSGTRNYSGRATRSYFFGGAAVVNDDTLKTFDVLVGMQP